MDLAEGGTLADYTKSQARILCLPELWNSFQHIQLAYGNQGHLSLSLSIKAEARLLASCFHVSP